MQRRGHHSAAVERDRHCAEQRVPCLGLAPVRLDPWPGTSARPNAQHLDSDCWGRVPVPQGSMQAPCHCSHAPHSPHCGCSSVLLVSALLPIQVGNWGSFFSFVPRQDVSDMCGWRWARANAHPASPSMWNPPSHSVCFCGTCWGLVWNAVKGFLPHLFPSRRQLSDLEHNLTFKYFYILPLPPFPIKMKLILLGFSVN